MEKNQTDEDAEDPQGVSHGGRVHAVEHVVQSEQAQHGGEEHEYAEGQKNQANYTQHIMYHAVFPPAGTVPVCFDAGRGG